MVPVLGEGQDLGWSQVLQKNTKFSWLSSDVPQLLPILGQVPPDKVDGLVVECDPPNRLGWRITGELGPFMVHWLIPTTTGSLNPWGLESAWSLSKRWLPEWRRAGRERSYPEFTHLSHEHWLEGLKWISEHDQKRSANKG